MTQSKKYSFFSIASLLLLSICLNHQAFAGTVSYAFAGTFDSVAGTLPWSAVAPGVPFTGTVTFDPQQSAIQDNNGHRLYSRTAPDNFMTVGFGETTLSTHSSWAPLGIRLEESYSGTDLFVVGGYLNDGTTNVTLVLEGPLGACLENHELSSFPTNVSCFTIRNDFWMVKRNFYGDFTVHGTIDSVVSQTPSVLLGDLINAVAQLNVRAGIVNSLDSKLQNALDALNDARGGNNASTINKLNAFINSVNAQRGNGLTDQEADYLINLANRIIAAISVQ
jgi:hypothetical protein